MDWQRIHVFFLFYYRDRIGIHDLFGRGNRSIAKAKTLCAFFQNECFDRSGRDFDTTMELHVMLFFFLRPRSSILYKTKNISFLLGVLYHPSFLFSFPFCLETLYVSYNSKSSVFRVGKSLRYCHIGSFLLDDCHEMSRDIYIYAIS